MGASNRKRRICIDFHRNARSATLWLDGTINLDGEIHHVRRADGPVRISQGGEFTFLRV